ncbi:hypothetical protein HWC26_gp043 [Aeromonas phage 2L372X]|uniref:Uncharacterized protein n=1 Tax=Aeromonas phage 2L372X TaxID=2588515 RepID=A0A5B9N655_9CAUD|nr:hypothetical protein HWC26_gp043 [Aeromonas phage 2L372X]QEG08295.1 hypothetical protein [Aeromonas phage 2L372X]
MSLLHLLSVDNDLSFDGKGLDKTVDNIKGYANNKFSEDDIDSANSILEDILSCAESIDTLENISNNVDSLVNSTENLVLSHIAVYKILKQISEEASKYCDSDNKQHIQDLLLCIAEQADDAMYHLNQELHVEIEPKYLFGTENTKFIKYVDFDFIPDFAVLSHSDKSGQVCYASGDWEFELSTYVGYDGLRLTPKTLKYKHLDFCKAYDKIAEIGLDPKNLTIEDVQLLKIVDNQNELVYNLFIK